MSNQEQRTAENRVMKWFASPRNLGGTWSFQFAERFAGRVEIWLPEWLAVSLFIPFVVTVTVLAVIEYGLRYLVTPQRIWNQ